jgi:lysophospholipase L1-like esterase
MIDAKADPIHPYQAGYEQMADVWYAAIKAILP